MWRLKHHKGNGFFFIRSPLGNERGKELDFLWWHFKMNGWSLKITQFETENHLNQTNLLFWVQNVNFPGCYTRKISIARKEGTVWKPRKMEGGWKMKSTTNEKIKKKLVVWITFFEGDGSDTVDGRNPAPVDRSFIPLFARSYVS